MSQLAPPRFAHKLVKWAAWPIILLTFVSVAFVGANVAQNKAISPLDEYVYIDYLAKVPSQGFVRNGEETGALARHEIACRGVQVYGLYGQSCALSAKSPDSSFPYSGQTGASIYTPAYFAVTWVLAQPLVLAGMSLLDAGRMVGGVWLALGTSLLFVLLCMLRVPRTVSLALSLFVIATPIAYWATSYISTDAPTLAVAAGLGIIALRVARSQLNGVWLVLGSAVAVLFKVQNLAAVAVCALALAIAAVVGAWRNQGTEPRIGQTLAALLRSRKAWVAVAAPLVAIIAQLGWLVIRGRSTIEGAPAPQIDTTQMPFSVQAIVDESLTFIWAIGSSGIHAGLLEFIVASVLTFFAIGAIVALLLRPRPGDEEARVIAGSTLFVSLILGPALALATVVLVGYYVPLTERYGLPLLPAFVACIGVLLAGRSARFGYGVLGVGGLAALAAVVLAF